MKNLLCKLPSPFLFLTLILLLVTRFSSAEESWSLEKSKNGIDIYVRSVEGSPIKEFKGVMTLPSTLSAVVALLDDSEAAPKWIYNCQSMDLLKSDGLKKWSYIVNKLPWPATDRDAIVLSIMRQNPATLQVSIALTAEPELQPEKKGLVRIPEMNAAWVLTPKAGGEVQVTYQAHVNPGGQLPTWLINSLLVDTPFSSLSAMRELVLTEHYQKQQRDDVVEPQA
ncbi:START domain-containing protein [Parendozoicomonas sp. Alg238-R29]|uniref:START domain-containing protein n=1 Tax=Parendozoicomonas sp. Alg238-R29 TaxID=2993446 RepID=UPI00248E0781|nr:START domain-containing protein [Parendozoicomonas sp. Alg238-R29]